MSSSLNRRGDQKTESGQSQSEKDCDQPNGNRDSARLGSVHGTLLHPEKGQLGQIFN